MPHTGPMDVQALILCGPGGSLNTFTSRPEEYPKCLIQVANRPMVFYAIDFCRRSGITDITLITPPLSFPPLRAALDQNPYLTRFYSPSVSVIAPKDLEMTMGTAELLRLPEVQGCITTNFLLLPCDLICEMPGQSIIEAWIANQWVLEDNSDSNGVHHASSTTSYFYRPLEARSGGLAVYYQTENREESIQAEATDFIAVAPLQQNEAPVVPAPEGSLIPRFNLSKLLMSMPMDTVKEKMKEDKGLLIRHSLVMTYPRIRMLTTFRDAHIYVFPHWVKDLVRYQKRLDSVSEDLVGTWAKSAWQKGLGDKLGLTKNFNEDTTHTQQGDFTPESSHTGAFVDKVIDIREMSTTRARSNSEMQLDLFYPSTELPEMLAYVHRGSTPFIRRVDSTAVLLSTSLLLAKLPSIDEVGSKAASPFAHAHKVAYPEGVDSPSNVTKKDCLLGDNVIVAPGAVIKESVIGANCRIDGAARIIRCVLMEGVVVEKRAELTGCVIGRRAQIGRGSVLRGCEVQDANVIPKATNARDEKFMVSAELCV
ncbi:Trimeric LpxA-like [Penicillium camemberti]|uniref:Translation initiation factor eIF2B subunit gamma n=1 Tax=Penicillium camemberti (strain FM 013) TaxID=1429867 RepID=A0A0G4P9S1_PENC3|nr:Trimeric LpxA-like [Penicillium camemberti]